MLNALIRTRFGICRTNGLGRPDWRTTLATRSLPTSTRADWSFSKRMGLLPSALPPTAMTSTFPS